MEKDIYVDDIDINIDTDKEPVHSMPNKVFQHLSL